MTSPTPINDPRPATGTWSLIHAERAALAADLEELTEQRWATQSLCDQFTVREVLAHLTAGASLNPVRCMAGVIRCRFDFDRQVAMRLAEHMGATPAETLARFRRVITSTTKPPLPTHRWMQVCMARTARVADWINQGLCCWRAGSCRIR